MLRGEVDTGRCTKKKTPIDSARSFTPDGFQNLCFEFGVEVDEDTEDDPARPADEPPELKIEIGANREWMREAEREA